MTVLDQTAPGLSEQLRAVSPKERRRVLIKACEAVRSSIQDVDPILQTFLALAAERKTLSPDQLTALREYVELADERYLTLKEQGESRQIWRNWFAKARLAAGLAGTCTSAEWQVAADAMYELCFVEEDDAAIISLVRSMLKSTQEG